MTHEITEPAAVLQLPLHDMLQPAIIEATFNIVTDLQSPSFQCFDRKRTSGLVLAHQEHGKYR